MQRDISSLVLRNHNLKNGITLNYDNRPTGTESNATRPAQPGDRGLCHPEEGRKDKQ